ncbi:sugar porter family MFS transporter [Yokenella regensburgei]|uniref:sugar porter family MFS transporter n=1 Tax=Yokenella regensburgei TaxID=158877 RepID=UPI003EDB0009
MKSNPYVYFIGVVASLGGLLFGYDTAVISGAVNYFEAYFSLTPAALGWAVSSALVGCIIGSVLSGALSSRFGRKKSLILCGILFFIGALGTAFPSTFEQFVFFRIVGGVGMGIASFVVPVYLAEIAPRDKRGTLGTFYQFAIAFGILLTYLINYGVQSSGGHSWLVNTGWRWMFGLGAVPAAILLVVSQVVPESPRWLTQKGRDDVCLALLERINSDAQQARKVHQEIKTDLARVSHSQGVFAAGLGSVLLLAIVLQVLSQSTGINVVIYYATKLLNSIGTGGSNTIWGNIFFQNVLIGLAVALSVFVALYYIERAGRKPLMIWGCVSVATSLLIIGFAVWLQMTGVWLLAVIIFFIFAFGGTIGPLTWIVVSEISPNSHRATIVSIATVFFWLTNVVVAQTFPMINDNPVLIKIFHGAFPFFIYGGLTLVFLWVCLRFLPETKGRSLEDIGQNMAHQKARGHGSLQEQK